MRKGAAVCRHQLRVSLFRSFVTLLVLTFESSATHAAGGGSALALGYSSAYAPHQEKHGSHRHLLQSSYIATACDTANKLVDSVVVQALASKLVGDAKLHLTAARFSGACNAFGVAAFSSTNSIAQQFSTALVLSTGDVSSVAAETNDPTARLSTYLNQPGDSSIGSYTYDAAILELDITVQPTSSNSGSNQLILDYLFGSEEYGLANANPDAIVIAIRPNSNSSTSSSDPKNRSGNSLQGYNDLALLPGGTHLPPPGAAAASVPIDVFYNTGSTYNTAWNGFTQVLPSQGFTVVPGGSYTLRIAIADASNGLLDSVLLLPVGSLKLYAAPKAAAGGPYAVAPNAKINLSAAKSSSANGAILSYLWQITPVGSSTPIITASNPVVTVPAPPAGSYNVTLEVWDVVGGHDSQTTSLSVDAANVLDWWSETPVFVTSSTLVVPPPTAVIAVNGTTTDIVNIKAPAAGPVLVTIDGSKSSDQRGTQLAYSWAIAQTEPSVKQLDVVLPYAEPAKFAYSLGPGGYLISLDVTGPGGITSAQTVVTVAANRPPIANAGGPYTATAGVPVVITADQSNDPDGDPLTYSWSLFNSAGAQVGSYTGQALSMKLNKIGTYTMKLTVTDDRGASSSTMTQIVNSAAPPAPPPTPPPVAAAGPPPAAAAAEIPATRALSPSVVTPQIPPVVSAPPPTPPPIVTYTPTVIAAVPAPPPSNARLADPATTSAAPTSSSPEAVYTTQSSPPASPNSTPAPTPSPPMCLYSKDSSGAVTPLWDSVYDSMDDYSQINLSLFPSHYWAECSNSTSSGSSNDSSTSSGSGSVQGTASTAVISGPAPFTKSTGAATQVYLDATNSTAAAGRSIVAFSWTIKRKSDDAVITQVTGLTTPVWLGPGRYSAALQITDTSGQTTAAQKDFAIGDAAQTTAVISSPGSFVQNAEATAVDVALSGVDSKAGPGCSIIHYQWMVLRLPDLAVLATAQGSTATVAVSVGSYRAYLAVFDSAGGNGTAVRDFLVGNRAAGGATAVITWPPELVQASSSSGATTIALDAAGSAPTSSNGSITQYAWAVVDLAAKTAAAQGTGHLTSVNLPPGSYQVGLLVVDSQGSTATARKNFAVGSNTSTPNKPPVVKAGMAFNGTVGGSFQITGVTGADGDTVSVTWALLDQTSGKTTTGAGPNVSLVGLAAGPHLLLITANNGQGGETSGTAAVTVLPSPATMPSSRNSTSGQRLRPSPTANIQKVPDLILPQGAVMDLDAVSLEMLPIGAKSDSYVWTMSARGTGEQVATVYGQLGHFELSSVGTFDIKLSVTDTSGKSHFSNGSVTVVAPASAAAAPYSWTGLNGSCGPFSSKQYSKAVLSCPSLGVAGTASQLKYAWRVITPTGQVATKKGSEASIVGLAPGQYRVEVAAAVGSIPSSQTTAYFTSTYLVVDPVTKLVLNLPESLCAGEVVSLHSPPLRQTASAEPEYQWKVTWEGSDRVIGSTEVLQGSGSSFEFMLKPGAYKVAMTAKMAGGAVVQGKGNITALLCIKCKNSTVTIDLPSDQCLAGHHLAHQVLAAPLPQGATLSWAAGALTTPGERQVTVVASALTTNATSSCSATVSFRDVTPPVVELVNGTGKCLTPVNSRWICWKSSELVTLSDNCQTVAALAFLVRCSGETTGANCFIRPDGQACVRASSAGLRLQLQVMARDGFGNVGAPVNVPVEVKAWDAAAGSECSIAALSTP